MAPMLFVYEKQIQNSFILRRAHINISFNEGN
jgi:hypothetical protein